MNFRERFPPRDDPTPDFTHNRNGRSSRRRNDVHHSARFVDPDPSVPHHPMTACKLCQAMPTIKPCPICGHKIRLTVYYNTGRHPT